MRYIIVGNSNYKCFKNVYLFQEDDYLIGLDEGAFTILDLGYPLKEAWGDFDESKRLDELKNKKIKIHKYNTDKNETDLELILMHRDFDQEILIYDVTGGRLDHEIVNILLLKKYQQLNLKLIDSQNEIRYISVPDYYRIAQDHYKYVSVISLNEATISIIKGKYKLDHVRITINDTYTTSNTYEDKEFIIRLFDGEIILIRSI